MRDAKNRGCFFNAQKDRGIMDVIIKNLPEIDQLADLVDIDSLNISGVQAGIMNFHLLCLFFKEVIILLVSS